LVQSQGIFDKEPRWRVKKKEVNWRSNYKKQHRRSGEQNKVKKQTLRRMGRDSNQEGEAHWKKGKSLKIKKTVGLKKWDQKGLWGKTLQLTWSTSGRKEGLINASQGGLEGGLSRHLLGTPCRQGRVPEKRRGQKKKS